MKKKIAAVLMLLLIPVYVFAFTGEVVSVTDGDTIKVIDGNQVIKVRLYGVDSPEMDQDFGLTAKNFTEGLVYGKQVDVEKVATDRYGRTVGIVTVIENNKNLNQELVKEGHAWVYNRYCIRPVCIDWANMEQDARLDKRGLWQEFNPDPPWEWRRQQK